MNLNDALKYTTDTVNNLATQFKKPEFDAVRWGTHPHELRGILADAYRDAGLEKDADLLSDPEQHVLVTTSNRIRAARFGGPDDVQTHRRYIQKVVNQHPSNYLLPEVELSDEEDGLPYGMVRVRQRFTDGHRDVSQRELPHHLSDLYGTHLRESQEFRDDPEGFAQLQDAIEEMRTARVEQTDHNHPSERR